MEKARVMKRWTFIQGTRLIQTPSPVSMILYTVVEIRVSRHVAAEANIEQLNYTFENVRSSGLVGNHIKMGLPRNEHNYSSMKANNHSYQIHKSPSRAVDMLL
jgi:hypothetical protein